MKMGLPRFRMRALLVVIVVTVAGLVVWAQQSSLIGGGFSSAGGTISSGDLVLTGSLGSWYSTQPLQGPNGLVVQPGRLRISSPVAKTGDLDGDADVDFTDFLAFAQAFGARTGEAAYSQIADFDSSGVIDFSDFLTFSAAFGG